MRPAGSRPGALSGPAGSGSGGVPGRPSSPVALERALGLPLVCAAALVTLAVPNREAPELFRAFLGAAAVLLLWSGGLYVTARRATRTLSLGFALHKHHWVQACAQLTILFYWGWHARFVYAFLPLILAQVVFAYAVDSLLTWSRRDAYTLGFGPIPVILSINLFLWFRPEWFHWQFAMIALGYAGKELIRWHRDGRSRHIFNPSSFPLAIFALVLILTEGSDLTFGNLIANSQFDPPYIYLVIFLAAVPGQLLFGVASMTLSAVITMLAIGVVYFSATGTYLFFDAFIPVPVFLGMHLLFTDPSTSPRTELGRVWFGVLYAVLIAVFFVVLSGLGIPTFYDKLLPVPFMNLMVRRIDRLAESRPLAALDPARVGRALSQGQRNVAYTFVWVSVFMVMSANQAVGDRHPGQYLPFWREACGSGIARACDYTSYLTLAYCNNGSGWACNEIGIGLIRTEGSGDALFTRGCELGFAPACENVGWTGTDTEGIARAGPAVGDLPIVLRGTKPALEERDPARLWALACEQGWPGACEASG
jgi:hypothetical protein